jgi:short subunit dehydrogenase-like uncharacterized protein
VGELGTGDSRLTGERKIMTFVVAGATGQLGRLVVAELLDSKFQPERIVAAGRDVSKIGDFAAQFRCALRIPPEQLVSGELY